MNRYVDTVRPSAVKSEVCLVIETRSIDFDVRAVQLASKSVVCDTRMNVRLKEY